jgi:tetratricopeptide (TPR) repeat protein
MTTAQEVLKHSQQLASQRKFAEAQTLLRKGVRQFPGERSIPLQLAKLNELLKTYPAALSIYKQLSDAKGGKPEAEVAVGLARCLLATHQIEQATKLFQQLQPQMPKHVDVIWGLASCLRQKNKFDDAEQLLAQAFEIKPGHPPSIHESAHLALARKQIDEALRLLEQNVCREDLYGDSIDLWMETLRNHQRERYMQEKLKELSEKYPNKVEFVFAYAVTTHRAGEITLARPALDKANALSPNNFKILFEYGVLERMAGNIEKSQEFLAQALALNPNHPAGIRTYGVDYKYAYGDPVFTRLNTVAAGLTSMKAEDQVQMHFALGKAFDDVGELESAFKHYAVGGEKHRKLSPYKERENARMFDLVAKLVTKDRLDKSNQPGYQDETPVFILGMPRSGTSLMEQILSSHPDVFGAGELKVMTSVLENIDIAGTRLRMGEVQAAFPYEQNAHWSARGMAYVKRVQALAPRDYKRIVDKMPGNFNFVGLIQAILPKAKIIHSRRHPVETCLSCYRIHFAEGQQWSYNLSELGRYYRRYWNMMKHWREQFPGAMYEVRYEDNVADVEGQARALIEYLGLTWNDACLEFYNTDRPVKTASASQVRKPIYATSTNRWRRYEKHLGPLLEEIGDIVEEYEAEIAHLIQKN